MFVPFHPAPAAHELPPVFPTPFRPGAPHPLAERAAHETRRFLTDHPFVSRDMVQGPVGGKMIGVLVVRARDGRIGYLRGFAGTLGDRWDVEGFVPPAFDQATFERIWAAGSAEISRLDRAISGLRERGELSPDHQAGLADLVWAQREHSRSIYAELHGTYRLRNAAGEVRSLRDLFAPHLPPGGAGDCAGPKLVAHAHALDARPIALAEFWWGAPPRAGGRQDGVFYPACRGRCAKILPFMLQGIPCEPPPDVGLRPVDPDAPQAVHLDAAIIVVDKPAGLLSVPGRGPTRADSVQSRLQARHGSGDGTWPRMAHRLDLATSGLLIAARDRDALVALQRQFSAQAVDKRYVAIVQGRVEPDRGWIDLPLRPDIDDRPRQVVDRAHGRPSRTHFEVLARLPDDRTRIALRPATGRTHQLRLHAAHPEGLGSPIVGDVLYGFGGDRLLLHASNVAFRHPVTGAMLRLSSEPPF